MKFKQAQRLKTRDIYDLDKKLAGAMRNFFEGDKLLEYRKGLKNPWATRHVSARNKELIREYDRYLQIKEKSTQTRYKNFYTLAALTQELGKDFDKLTRQDIEEYLRSPTLKRLAPKTAQVRKLSIKVMVRWLAKEKEIPASKKLWEWLNDEVKTTLNVKSIEETINLDKANLLDEGEVLDFVKFNRGKDRAFLFLLYETGARIGEILPLKRRDIALVEGGYALVTLRGKTGLREVPVKACVPDLVTWLNYLPDNPSQDLWIIEGTRGDGTRYDYRAMMRRVYDLGRKWQATKEKPWSEEKLMAKLHLHNWRHSRATELAKRGWSEYELCTYFGWKVGSKIPGVYIRLSGRDLMRRLRIDEGVVEEKLKPSELSLSECPLCHEKQSAANALCVKCGTPLTLQDFNKWYQERRQSEKKLEVAATLLARIMDAKKEGGRFTVHDAKKLAKAMGYERPEKV